MKALADSHSLSDSDWMDGVTVGQHSGLMSDFTHFMKRFSGWFTEIDVQYVDPWERKRR